MVKNDLYCVLIDQLPGGFVQTGEVTQGHQSLEVLQSITLNTEEEGDGSDDVTGSAPGECNGWVLGDSYPGESLSSASLAFISSILNNTLLLTIPS